jgi:hypothetical protein
VSTTYGGLLTAANFALDDANRSITLHRFDTAVDAAQALVDYHGLLDALAGHTWALLTPEQASGIRASQGPHPVEVAAINMAEAIGTLTHTRGPHPAMHTQGVTTWARAARCVRAAGDLLATHETPGRGPRSPDAHLIRDPDVRVSALNRVGQLTVTLLDVEDTLALRALQTGLHPATVRRALPALSHIAALAHATAGHNNADTTPAAPDVAAGLQRLDDLSLATTPIRTDNPAAELTDRYTRIRLHAWQLLQSPDYSVATLRDLAILGVATHAHTAALHGGDLTQPDAHSPHLRPLLERARAWQTLSHALTDLAAAGPGNPVVHEDLIGITRTLQTVAPLAPTTTRSTRATGLDRQLVAVLNGAVATMTEIAGWNSVALDRLARSGHVFVPGHLLTGEQVTNNPDLVTAHLTDHLAPAPPRRVEQITTLYQDLRADAVPAMDRASVPGRAAQQDHDIEPIGRRIGQ